MKQFVNRLANQLVAGSLIFVLAVNPALAALQNNLPTNPHNAAAVSDQQKINEQQKIAANKIQPIKVDAAQLPNNQALVLDPNNHQTDLKQASNGTTVIDIATPTTKGVSQNNFSEFNVDQSGIIFNNSQGPVLTQLGGWSDGNRRLAGGPAKIILTQVTGSNRSQLLGQVEIAGQSADFILANANGITCNGCGFINTPRVSLITGNAQYDASGNLGFNVLNGDVSIEGQGLNASNISRFDIITRAAKINAAIYANELNVITGKNNIDYAQGDITSLADNSNSPSIQFAIDSSALGGMYANSIRLIGTEKGVGVNTQGLVQSISDLEISADGDIHLKTAQANNQIKIQSASGSINNQGTVYGKTVDLNASSYISNTGLLAAQDAMHLSGDFFDQRGNLYSGLKADNTLTGQGNLSAHFANGITNQNDFYAAGAADILAGNLDNSGTFVLQSEKNIAGIQQIKNRGNLQFNAKDSVILNTQNLDNQNGTLSYSGDGTFQITTAQNFDNTQGILSAHNNLILTLGQLNNNQGLISANVIDLATNNIENNSGTIESVQLQIKANDLNNQSGVITAIPVANSNSSSNLSSSIDLSGALNNQQGTLYLANAQTTLNAQSIDNTQGAIIFANHALANVTTQTDINNNVGLIQSGNLNLNTKNINNNQGQVIADIAQLNAQAITNDSGLLQAKQWKIAADDYQSNGGYLLATDTNSANLDLKLANQFNQTNGAVLQSQSGGVSIQANNIVNTDSAIYSLGTDPFNLSVKNIDNQRGAISANGQAIFTIANLDNSLGFISANGITLVADQIKNQNGLIKNSGADFSVTANQLDNTQGVMSSAGTANFSITTTVNNTQGTLNSNQSFVLSAADFNNNQGSLISANNLQLNALNQINNDAGQLIASQQLQLKAATINNGAGLISADDLKLQTTQFSVGGNGSVQANHLALDAATIQNAGFIFSSGQAANDFSINTQSLHNTGTLEAASKDWDLSQLSLVNDHGSLVHDGTGELKLGSISNASTFDNSYSVIATQGTLTLNATAINNDHGTLIAVKDLAVNLQTINNNYGVLQSGGQFQLQTDQLINTNGNLILNGAADATLSVTHAINNLNGNIVYSGHSKFLVTADSINNQNGNISSQNDLDINLLSALDNTLGQINAINHLVITTSNLTNGGDLSAQHLNFNVQYFKNLATANINAGDLQLTNAKTFANLGNLHLIDNQAVSSLNVAQTFTNAGYLETNNLQTQLLNGVWTNTGTISSLSGNLIIDTQGFNNSGTVSAKQIEFHNSLGTQNFNNQNGRLIADQITGSLNNINNQQGLLQANDQLQLTANQLDNSAQGKLLSQGTALSQLNLALLNNNGGVVSIDNLKIIASSLNNQSGEIVAKQLNAQTDILDNSNGGSIATTDQLSISSASLFNNSKGLIQSNGKDLSITAATLDNTDGKIYLNGNGELKIIADQLINTINADAKAGIYSANNINLQLSQDFNNQATLQAAESLGVNSKSPASQVVNTAWIQAKNISIVSNNFQNDGTLYSNNIDLTTNTAINNKDIILNGTSNFNSVSALVNKGSIENHAQDWNLSNVDNQNTIQLVGTGDLTLAKFSNENGAAVFSNGNLNIQDLTSGSQFSNQGNLNALNNINLQIDSLNNQNGKIIAGNQFTITAKDLNNQNGLILSQATSASLSSITLTNQLDNSLGGFIQSGAKDLTIQAGKINNASGVINHLGVGSLTLNANQGVDNTAGHIQSSGAVTISANGATASIQNNNGQILGKNIQLTATQSISNQGADATHFGEISGDNITLTANTINNSYGLIAAKNPTIGFIQFNTPSVINNQYGEISSSAANWNLNLDLFDNTSGSIVHSGTGQLQLTSATQLNNAGTISSRGDLNLTAAGLNNSGNLISDKNLTLNLSGDLINQISGTISVAQDLAVSKFNSNAINITNQGNLGVGGVMQLNVGQGDFTNNGSVVLKGGSDTWSLNNFVNNNNFSYNGTGDLNITATQWQNTGTLQVANGNLIINAPTVSNTKNIYANQLIAKGVNNFTNDTGADLNTNQLQINSASQVIGTFANKGTVEAADNNNSLLIYVATLNNAGTITSNSVDQHFYGDFNNGGEFIHSGGGNLYLGEVGTITLGSGSHLNTSGVANISSSLNGSGDVFARNGIIINTGAQNLNTGNINYYTFGNLTLNTNQLVNDGKLESDGNLTITALDKVINNGLIQGQAINLTATQLTNTSKIISLGASITDIGSINVNSLNNSNGFIGSENSTFTITSASDIVNSQGAIQLYRNGILNLTATSNIDNSQQGIIHSDGALSIKASLLNNSNTARAQVTDKTGIDADSFTMNVTQLNNTQGYIGATGSIDSSIKATDLFNNTQGDIEVNSTNFTITPTNQLINTDGKISHSGTGTLKIDSANFNLAGNSFIGSRGAIALTTASDLTNAGQILGDQQVTITAHNLNNQNVIACAFGNVDLELSSFQLTNSHLINGNQKLTINAASIDNSSALESKNNIDISTNSFTKIGNIKSDDTLTITLSNGDLVLGSTDAISAPGNLVVHLTNGGFNNSGSLSSNLGMTLDGKYLTNQSGATIAVGNGQGNFIISGDVINNGTISAKSALTINAHNFTNSDTALVVTGDNLTFDLNNNDFINHGVIFSNKDFVVKNTNNFTNETLIGSPQAQIYSGGNLNITVGNFIHNLGANIDSLGTLTLDTINLGSSTEILNQSYFTPDYVDTTPTISFAQGPSSFTTITVGGYSQTVEIIPISKISTYQQQVINSGSSVNARISASGNLQLGHSGNTNLAITNDKGDIFSDTTLNVDAKSLTLNSVVESTITTTETTDNWYIRTCNGCLPGAPGPGSSPYQTVTHLPQVNSTIDAVVAGRIRSVQDANLNLLDGINFTYDKVSSFSSQNKTPDDVLNGNAATGKASGASGLTTFNNPLNPNAVSSGSTGSSNYLGATVTWNDLKAGAGSSGKNAAGSLTDAATGANSNGKTQINYVSAVDVDQLHQLAQSNALNNLLTQLNGKALSADELLALIAQIKSGKNPFTTDQALQDFLNGVNDWFNANLSDADKALLTSQTDLANLTANAKPQLGNTKAPQIISIDILPYGFDLSHLSGLFVVNTAPDAKYLIETRPEFIQYGNFLGSDYLIKELGLDPSKTEKRLGDAFFEDQLIKDALMRDLSTAYLDGQTDDYKMMQLLMDNAVQQNKSLQLSVGVELTPEQCAHLTEDMIWLVEKTVKGQKVLVPHLYLASVSNDKLEASKASLAAGGTLDLTVKNGITNNTKIVANNLLMSTQGSLDNQGTLVAHGDIRLLADQNLRNIGKISGDTVGLLAKGDVTNSGSIKAINSIQMMSTQGSVINAPKAEINSQGLVAIAAQQDIKNQNGKIEGDDVNLFTQTGDIQFEPPAAGNKNNGLIVHHDLQMDAGHNVDLQGAQISVSNNVNIHAANDVLLTAADSIKNTASTLEELRNPSFTKNVASISAANQIAISAGHDVNAEATQFSSGGDLILNAGHDVNLTALQQQTQTNTSYKKHTVTTNSTSYDVANLQADKNISITAGHDVNAQSTQFKAGGNVGIAAANDLNFNALENTTHTQDISKNKKVIDDTVTHQLVNIQSTNGNVQLSAGNDANLTGVNVDAKQNVIIDAQRDTNISAVADSVYHYDKTTKKSGGVLTSTKKTTINETLSQTSVGGEISGDNVLINAHVNDDGQVIGDKSGNVNLAGAQIKAKNTAIISADEDVNASAIQLQQNDFHQTKKSGSFGLSKRDSGSVEKNTTLTNATISGDNNVILLANNIKLVGTNVTSTNGDINMEAVDQLIVSAGDISKSAQQWNNKSSVFTDGKLYSNHEHKEGVTENTTQASNISAAGVITAKAGEIHIKGSHVSGDQGVSLSADSGDIEVTAATNHSESYSHDKDMSVGFGDVVKNLSHPDQIVKNKEGRATIKFADANYAEVDEKTTITGADSSSIDSKNGNVILNATAGKITLAGSSIDAKNGTVGLLGANGVDVTTVDEAIDKEKKSTVGKAELSVVVQHEAVEVVVAVKNVDEAKNKLDQAKKDYKNYQRNLDGLETQLKDLEADVANKKPGVNAADVVELKQLISDTKSDEKFFKEGIALAAVGVTSATAALAQQIYAASQSEGTWGFNAGVQLDLDATKTQTSSHDSFESGSTINAKNLIIQTGKKNDDGSYAAKGTTTNIHGSQLNITDTAVINTGELNVTAAESTHESTTKNEHGHITAQMTVYGASGGASVNGSFDRSQNSERSTTYTNSEINADKISITTTDNANFNGATVHAVSDLNMDIGGDLNVESVQNRSSSRSTSTGISGGMSFGGTQATEENHSFGTKDVNGASGFNAGINNSNSRSTTKETVLTSITSGGTATVNVKGHTQLTGAEIATVDADGNDTGKLNFSTDSFDFTDLKNINSSSSHSYGVSTNFSLSKNPNADKNENASNTATVKTPTSESTTSTGKILSSNSSNINFSNSNTNDASKTLATLGRGNISIGGVDVEKNGVPTDSTLLDGLNRDTYSTNLNLWNSSTTQTVDANIDHRLVKNPGEVYQQIKDIHKNLEIGIHHGIVAFEDMTDKDNIKNDFRFNMVTVKGMSADAADDLVTDLSSKGVFANISAVSKAIKENPNYSIYDLKNLTLENTFSSEHKHRDTPEDSNEVTVYAHGTPNDFGYVLVDTTLMVNQSVNSLSPDQKKYGGEAFNLLTSGAIGYGMGKATEVGMEYLPDSTKQNLAKFGGKIDGLETQLSETTIGFLLSDKENGTKIYYDGTDKNREIDQDVAQGRVDGTKLVIGGLLSVSGATGVIKAIKSESSIARSGAKAGIKDKVPGIEDHEAGFIRPNHADTDLKTSSGIVIKVTQGKTTTVLGSYQSDTKNIIDEQLMLSKNPDYLAANPGGFNVLNVPDRMAVRDIKDPDKFWREVNEPFLEAAVQRGDEIYLATKPTDNVLNRIREDGNIERSGFGKEYDYLIDKGYAYDETVGKMIKVNKP